MFVSMDWDFSIERNRGMLLPHIVGLFAMIGLVEGGIGRESVAAALSESRGHIAVGGISGQAIDHRHGAQH